ncbi:hypothetical protein QZH41_009482, partial [Actinostola sp. cb2023]
QKVDKNSLNITINDEWKDLTIEVWDCGGRKYIQGLHPLFLTDQTLYVLTFNVHNPRDIENMPNWLFLVQTKTPGCPIIVVGTHADGSIADYTNISAKALDTLKAAENEHYLEVKAELDILKTEDKKSDPFIQTRITRLEQLLNCRPRLPDKVLYVSSIKGKGITDIQNAIFTLLLDPALFPHLTEEIPINITYLYSEILKLRDDQVVVISWDQYVKLASESGINDPAAIEKATTTLEYRGCITVFRIPASNQDRSQTRTVCVNPSILLDCLACMHNETEPKEFVPRFIKAGYLDRYWPTNTKPNDWTLRSAIDDIVSKGLVREAVVPLCFQASLKHTLYEQMTAKKNIKQAIHLNEQEILKILRFCRDIGVLVEGAPKGSYEVELVLAYYKNLSVVKRYFLPLQDKLPVDTKTPNIWPSAVPEGHIQVGWRFKFPDEISSKCSTLIIGSCRNFKMSSDIYCYCQRCLVLKVGDVMVKISRDGSYLDMIGRSKITHGSKQALNMTWFILAQFFYVTDTLLQNYSGLSPEIMVPLYGCSRPKHKSLFELVKDYNVEPCQLANFRWFLPPGGLDADEHTQIPSDTSTWLSTIAKKSTLFISYQSDHQDEVKLLRVSLEHSGFNCVGEWTLLGHGQEQTERRRQSIMGSSLLLAFVTPDYLKWSRAHQDINLALEVHKPVIALLFDKTRWPEDNDLEILLNNHAICLDFDAGSGEALSHQYDQEQLSNLVSQSNGILYGTGDIHPPEPPVSPDNTFHVQSEGTLRKHLDGLNHHERVEDTLELTHKAGSVEPEEDNEKKVQRMAASAVAAAVAGATAQHISKADNTPEAVKAAAAAAEVAKAVVDGNSDAAAKAIVKVAKIVEDSVKNQPHSKHMSNGSVSSPPKSTTCSIL